MTKFAWSAFKNNPKIWKICCTQFLCQDRNTQKSLPIKWYFATVICTTWPCDLNSCLHLDHMLNRYPSMFWKKKFKILKICIMSACKNIQVVFLKKFVFNSLLFKNLWNLHYLRRVTHQWSQPYRPINWLSQIIYVAINSFYTKMPVLKIFRVDVLLTGQCCQIGVMDFILD